MKKSIIAAGAASVALAAMPVVGVFADQNPVGSAVSDTITASFAPTCSFTSTGTDKESGLSPAGQSGDYAYSTVVTPGQAATDLGSTQMTIKCNQTGGWVLNAVGAGAAANHNNYMKSDNNVASEDVATGIATSGDTSNWAFKVTTTEAYASLIQGSYGNYAEIPDSATAVVKSTAATDITNGVTVSPKYQVFMSTKQAAGSYTGKVSYTLLQPAQ